MAKAKRSTRKNNTVVDMDDAPDPVATLDHDLSVSAGIADAEIAPAEPLGEGEVIRDEKEQSIVIDGTVHHHVREATDGRWIYAPVRPRA